jgi:hypothetical protein
MITLDRFQPIKSSTGIAYVTISSEEQEIITKYQDLNVVERVLLKLLGFQQPMNIYRLNDLLSRSIDQIGHEKYRLQNQWKDLHNCDKQAN